MNLATSHSFLRKAALLFSFFFLLFSFNSNAQWTQKGADIDGEAMHDESGYSVSMPDVHTIAIGARANSGNGSNAGHVRVHEWTGNVWAQKGADIDGEAAGDYSGWSVSMPNSNMLAIGSINNDGNGIDAGHVRIFRWNSTAWTQKGADIDGEAAGDKCGYSVSMPDTNTVAIGAYLNDGNGADAGQVRIYKWSGSAWVQKGLDIDGEAAGDHSGWSVSMPDSNTIAIGAPRNKPRGSYSSGHVRIYKWSGTAWLQKGVDIDAEATSDLSGYSVSMADSNTIAIGAPLNDGQGLSSGHVRVFSWNGSTWVQKGIDIDGDTVGDNSGWSVNMADANSLVIGAPFNDDNGLSSGQVRVFIWNGTAWVQNGIGQAGEALGDRFGFSVSMPDTIPI